MLYAMKSRNANWIGRILSMNCLLKHVIELRTVGKILGVGRSRRRCKQLLDNRKKTRYSKLKEKALDHTLHLSLSLSLSLSLWRTCFGRNNEPRAKQTHRPRHDNNTFSRQNF